MGTARIRHSVALLLTVAAVSGTIGNVSASIWTIPNGSTARAIGGTHDAASSAIGGTHDLASTAIGGTHWVDFGAIGGTHDLVATAIGGTHDTASSAIGGTHDLVATAIGGTHDRARSAIGRTRNLASTAIGGTHDTASSAIGGTHDLVATAIGGTHDAASSAIGGTHELVITAAASSIEVSEEGISIHGQLFSASNELANAVKNLRLDNNFNIVEATVGFSKAEGILKIASIRDTGELYVPGASFIRLLGMVSKVNGGIATFQIGRQLLDYSSLLGSDPNLFISKNQLVIVTGTQPAFQGKILVLEFETY